MNPIPIMKIFPFLSRGPFFGLATLLITHGLAVRLTGQTIDTSTGEVGNSATSRSRVPPENPAPTSLKTKLVPVEDGSKITGEVVFSVAGDVLNVSGRVDGLEPMMRYLLSVPSGPALANQEPVAAKDAPGGKASEAAERPIAGELNEASPTPASPTPASPTPANPRLATPGGVDSRAPTGGGGTQSAGMTGQNKSNATKAGAEVPEIATGSGVVGVLTADAKGGTNINLSLRDTTLTGSNEIMGRMVLVASVPPTGGEGESKVVASGRLTGTGAEGSEGK